MAAMRVAFVTVGVLLLCAGCSQHKIDFTCDVAGEAIVHVGSKKYTLPCTITFSGSRKDLRLELPASGRGKVTAKAEINFFSDYAPTDMDRYARLRAVLSRELIDMVAQGGAAKFTGYSASKQRVFEILFGKE